MIKGIRSLAITLISLITFLVIAAPLVWDCMAWECVCTNVECGECATDDDEWDAFHADAFEEYADAFTALFNATEFKVAKNGRSMVKGANSKSFKFAKSAK